MGADIPEMLPWEPQVANHLPCGPMDANVRPYGWMHRWMDTAPLIDLISIHKAFYQRSSRGPTLHAHDK